MLLFWIAVALLIVGALAAFIGIWESMSGQMAWLKLIASAAGAAATVMLLVVVFWIISGVSTYIAGYGLLPTTYKSQPTAQIVKETVVTEKVVQQTVVVEKVVTTTPLPTATPVPPTPTVMATSTRVLAESSGSSSSNWITNCSNLTAPSGGGQIFWSNHRVSGKNNDPYAVVYDPSQGGSGDHPALGWYYQPCLPVGPDRNAHEVAIVLQPGNYRFTGPECRVWHNWDGKHPWEQGTLLINQQNLLSINIPATRGTNPAESWVAIKCSTSAASGFSFEKLP